LIWGFIGAAVRGWWLIQGCAGTGSWVLAGRRSKVKVKTLALISWTETDILHISGEARQGGNEGRTTYQQSLRTEFCTIVILSLDAVLKLMCSA